MSLRIYNTLTRSLDALEPLEPGSVRIYACGPTVYQQPHVGNYRTFLVCDLVHRYLLWKGYRVKFVMNLTDVDDRTITGAQAAGIRLADFTAPVAEGFLEDLRTLGTRGADAYPRATAHVPAMVELIGRLIERGHAYVADGSVYFDIASWPEYGKLSRVDLGAVREGAGLEQRDRVVDPEEQGKRDARDFALWKAARAVDREVDAVWPTPWGEGRPGWHIECSAMSMAELGDSFDMHMGGEDLIFPHHEDEIAQSEAATGEPFARHWLHVKHLVVEGEKMSKSLGNVVYVRRLLEEGYTAAAVRYLLLSAHYRKELNFTFDGLRGAQATLARLQRFETRLETETGEGEAAGLEGLAERALAGFEAALDEDLNTAAALAALHDFVSEGNAALDRAGQRATRAELEAALTALRRMDEVLGVLSLARSGAAVDDELSAWVEGKIEERQAARARRDFAAADAIRAELTAAGITVEDTPQGARWKRG